MIELLIAVQINCLAEAIFAEARGEDYAGQVLVAGVIKNRVLDERFEDNFCKVIEQPYQFSFVHEISREKLEMSITEEEAAWERAQNIAYSVVNSGVEPLFDNILYYHADYVEPAWDYSKLVQSSAVGSHIFYKDEV
jgi:spore germination cell wall hydrolase CwlJ-like protein